MFPLAGTRSDIFPFVCETKTKTTQKFQLVFDKCSNMNKIAFIDKVFSFNFLRKVFLMSSNHLKIVFYGIFFFTISVCDNINQQIEKNKFSVQEKIICLRLITKLCSPIVLSTHFRYIHWNDWEKIFFFWRKQKSRVSLACRTASQCWPVLIEFPIIRFRIIFHTYTQPAGFGKRMWVCALAICLTCGVL